MAAVREQLLTPRDPDLPWTAGDAAHLLTRVQFGFTPPELDRVVREGPSATLERLLSPQPESAEFQAADQALRETALATANSADLKAWWLYRMRFSANPLVEKMTLFWHNLFATSNAKVNHVGRMTRQTNAQRAQALGDFRILLHEMARDPAMLIWLDGNANRKRHPNENFAREVMELFSLGQGNYSERDVQEAARAFTGWHVRDGEFWFNELQHDPGEKTVFGKTGRFDGNDLIDLCLAHPACPKFLASKLLRTFVVPAPSVDHVDTVAASIQRHEFRFAPVLRDLFSSEMFFDPSHRQALIKSPLDFVLGSLRALEVSVRWPPVVELLADLGQSVFEPPSVKGWDGGRLWINTSTLLLRANFVTGLCYGEKYGVPDFTRRLGAASDPDALIPRSIAVCLCGRTARPDLAAELEVLWRETDGDATHKLRSLVSAVMTLPEYQLH